MTDAAALLGALRTLEGVWPSSTNPKAIDQATGDFLWPSVPSKPAVDLVLDAARSDAPRFPEEVVEALGCERARQLLEIVRNADPAEVADARGIIAESRGLRRSRAGRHVEVSRTVKFHVRLLVATRFLSSPTRSMTARGRINVAAVCRSLVPAWKPLTVPDLDGGRVTIASAARLRRVYVDAVAEAERDRLSGDRPAGDKTIAAVLGIPAEAADAGIENWLGRLGPNGVLTLAATLRARRRAKAVKPKSTVRQNS